MEALNINQTTNHQAFVGSIKESVRAANDEHNAWVISRRAGIGGSDVGAILGVNPWMTPLDVYRLKRGYQEPIDLSDNDKVLAGILLEDAVAQFYSTRSGDKVRRVNQTRVIQEKPWLLANVDRIVEGKRKVLECKTAGHFARGWGASGSDEVPESYLLQVTHYMNVLGYKEADLAVLIGGQDFRIYKFQLDPYLARVVEDRLTEFWFDHVLADVPPEPTTLSEINAFYPKDNGASVEADQVVLNAISERANAAEVKKEAEEIIKEQDAIIKGYMGENLTLVDRSGAKLASWKAQTANRFDTTKFKKDHPDLYSAYTKASESRVFRI
jgi:putative phage-type endonuclease